MKYIAVNINFMAEKRDDLTPLGKWIKAALEDKRRNQAWLAEKVGVKPPQISRIMRGLSEAMPDLLDKIADHLGRPRVQIYRAAGHIEPVTEKDELEERILNALNSLPLEERQRWARSIEADVWFHEFKQTRRPVKRTSKTRP
jgi:transcriptional regulator with XRE-family HTH domain